MDAKALAKSKRAHSQQHSKKNHPKQKAKAPVDGGKANDAGSGKQPLGKQVNQKTPPTQSTSGLPSNWDRYEGEFNLGSEDPSGDGLNPASDVVLPRSKGADYRHLIAEAQSQSELNVYSDTFPSVDDVLAGYWNKGIGSMLSVRGQNILSWTGDDNFVVEDKTAAHHEVSFLSLNLHALAEQLEKIDLPQRLFIEADLLPPELISDNDITLFIQQHAEGLEATCSQSSDHQMQATCNNEAAQGISEEPNFSDFSEKAEVADQDIEIPVSGSPGSGNLDPTLPNLGSASVQQINIDPSNLCKSDHQSKPTESKTQTSVKSAQMSVKSFADVPKERVPTFEASSAEAELDTLLDSFSETKISDSSGFRFATTSVQQEASMAPLQFPTKGPDSSSIPGTANLDDALDDLINETSIMINQSGPSQPQEGRAVHVFQPSSHSGTKSKELDDFDSWLDTI